MTGGDPEVGESDFVGPSEGFVLKRIKRGKMLIALKKVYKELEDISKKTATSSNGTQDVSANTNANLTVARELEAMKPRLDDKTYDAVDHYTRFGRKIKEQNISDENMPQAALEYARTSPTKAKFTAADLELARAKAVGEGAKLQKEIDDKELAEYRPFVGFCEKLLDKVHAQQIEIRKQNSVEGMIENINNYREAGLVLIKKDLEEMGFFEWLMTHPRPPTMSQMPSESKLTVKQ
ncbi:MAG: hypothetical protein ABSB56_06600 [Nitrososphaerales archaeon]|jgi:hypothetical protein